MSIEVTQRGSFKNTESYLQRLKNLKLRDKMNKYGSLGVNALSNATPVRTGLTSQSWYYEITERSGYLSIRWFNSHVVNGVPIAIILQYGHGTRNGGYVQGRDYIMPAMRPIFDQMADEAWKEVTRI